MAETAVNVPVHMIQKTELKSGDQVIYGGHQYWVMLTITMGDGSTVYALRQAHWPVGHCLHVKQEDLMPDVPFTA